MSKAKPRFPFLKLPPELRNFICKHALYDENDRRIGYHCPTILLINRQIYSEASRLQYAKTHTLTVSRRHMRFLNREYRDGINENFPLSFPYHKLEALRIRILRPMTKDFITLAYDLYSILADYQYFWPLFEEHMEQLRKLMRTIVDKGLPLRRLILDVRDPYSSHEPPSSRDYEAMQMNMCRLFGMLGFSKGTTHACKIVLGTWAKTCPKMVQAAEDWGFAAICHDSREGDKEGEPEEPVILFGEVDSEEKDAD